MQHLPLPRRAVLLGLSAGALGLTGCGRSQSDADVEPSARPDAQVLDEFTLIAAYDAALVEAEDPLLRSIRDQHADHVRVLGGDPDAGGAPSPTASATPNRRRLRRLEAAAARNRRAAAVASGDVETAQMLALIAASEFQHSLLLEQA